VLISLNVSHDKLQQIMKVKIKAFLLYSVLIVIIFLQVKLDGLSYNLLKEMSRNIFLIERKLYINTTSSTSNINGNNTIIL